MWVQTRPSYPPDPQRARPAHSGTRDIASTRMPSKTPDAKSCASRTYNTAAVMLAPALDRDATAGSKPLGV